MKTLPSFTTRDALLEEMVDLNNACKIMNTCMDLILAESHPLDLKALVIARRVFYLLNARWNDVATRQWRKL